MIWKLSKWIKVSYSYILTLKTSCICKQVIVIQWHKSIGIAKSNCSMPIECCTALNKVIWCRAAWTHKLQKKSKFDSTLTVRRLNVKLHDASSRVALSCRAGPLTHLDHCRFFDSGPWQYPAVSALKMANNSYSNFLTLLRRFIGFSFVPYNCQNDENKTEVSWATLRHPWNTNLPTCPTIPCGPYILISHRQI